MCRIGVALGGYVLSHLWSTRGGCTLAIGEHHLWVFFDERVTRMTTTTPLSADQLQALGRALRDCGRADDANIKSDLLSKAQQAQYAADLTRQLRYEGLWNDDVSASQFVYWAQPSWVVGTRCERAWDLAAGSVAR